MYEGCEFSNNKIQNLIFLKNQNSSLNLINCLFIDNFVENQAIFLVSNYRMNFTEIYAVNNTFLGFFFVSEDSSKFLLVFSFYGSMFLNNSGNILFNICNFLGESNVILHNLRFYSNNFNDSILKICHVSFLRVLNISFENNTALHLNKLSYIQSIDIQNFSCVNNNQMLLSKCSFCSGSCLYISNSNFLGLSFVQIKQCYSENYTPGIIVSNLDKIEITNIIFSENSYFSTNKVSSFGTCLSIISCSEVIINNGWFYKNSLDLTKEIYGSPAIFFLFLKGALSIINSRFERNFSFKRSLSLGFYGYNLTVKNTYFGFLKQMDFSQYSAYLVSGSLTYLQVIDCLFQNNEANYGFFLLEDFSQTFILFDNISLFENSGSSTGAISLGFETKNKIIIWKNSKIFNNVYFKTEAMFIYTYIPRIIKNLSISFINNWISNNTLQPAGYYGMLVIMWSFSKDVMFLVESCNFTNNKGFLIFFSIYGIKSLINFNIVDCVFMKNVFFDLLDADRIILNFQKNSLIDDYYTSNLLRSTRSNITLISNYMINTTGNSYSSFTFYDHVNLNITNLTINSMNNLGKSFYLKDLDSCFLMNLTFQNLVCENLLVFINCQIEKIENMIINNGSFISIMNYKRSNLLKLINLYIKNIEAKNVLSITENTYFQSSNIHYDLSNIAINQISFLILYSSTAIFLKLNFDMFFIINNRPQFIIAKSNLTISNSFISSFVAASYFFHCDKSEFNLFDGIMENIHFWLEMKKTVVTIKNCNFFNDKNFNRIINNDNNLPHFIFDACNQSEIINSNFTNIKAFNTSPIMISNSLNFKITQCIFKNLTSEKSNGGALYFMNSYNILISSCYFLENYAFGQGGAIFFFCSEEAKSSCNYSISSNSFIGNKARVTGGAYHWIYSKPIENKDNTFVNNQAVFSANDYSSFFCRLGFHLILKEDGQKIKLFDSFGGNSSEKLMIRQRGNLNESFFLEFFPLDSYNQLINIIVDSQQMTVSLDQGEDIENEIICSKAKIYGKTNQILENSTFFKFDNLMIIGCPDTVINLNFSIRLGFTFPPIFNLNNSQNEQKTQEGLYEILIPILLSSCEIGEIFDRIALKCQKCLENYYSFNINDSECKLCPKNSYCPGGSIMIIDENYWSSSNQSSNIYRCYRNLGNCLGGYPSKCSQDFEGILCNVCKGKQRKNFLGTCTECPSGFLNIFSNFLVLLIFILMIVTFIFFVTNIKSQEKLFVIRILADYLHLVYLTQKYDIILLKSSFEISLFYYVTSWLSIGCFVSLVSPSNDNFYEPFWKISLFYFGLLIYLILLKFKKDKERVIKSIWLYYYITFPFISSFLLENLVCQEIDDVNVLISNTRINCDGDFYFYNQNLFVIPNMILLFFILPVFLIITQIYINKGYIFVTVKNFFRKENQFKKFRYEIFMFFEKIILIIVYSIGLKEDIQFLCDFFVLLISFAWLIFQSEHFLTSFVFGLMKFLFLVNSYSYLFVNYYNVMAPAFMIVFSTVLKLALAFCCLVVYHRIINSKRNFQELFIKVKKRIMPQRKKIKAFFPIAKRKIQF